MALSLLYTYICYTLLLPFKKLVIVLMFTKAWRNSQSKAVWVIRVARAEKRVRNIRINLKALEETSMFFGEQRILFNSSFLFEFLPLSGFWIPLFMLLVSSIFWRWFFSVFGVNFAILLLDSAKFTCGRHFGYCFHSRPCFWLTFRVVRFTVISKCYFPVFLIFLLLFQECSVVNTLGSIACLGLFPPGGMVSTTRRRFGKTMVEVVHPGEFRFI